MNDMLRRWVPAGMGGPALVLHVLLLVLPCAALALALPTRPHGLVVALVVAGSAWWARRPEHLTGTTTLALVAGWWAVHGVVDWRVLVVGVLLVAAHVVATLLSYGPDALPVDRHLAVLWVRRTLLALVPLPVTWLAVRGLDADLAPSWLWMVAALGVMGLMVATLRLTQPEEG